MNEEKKDEQKPEQKILPQLLNSKILEERIKLLEIRQANDRAYVDSKISSIALKTIVGFVIIGLVVLILFYWNYYTSGTLLALITKTIIKLGESGIKV